MGILLLIFQPEIFCLLQKMVEYRGKAVLLDMQEANL